MDALEFCCLFERLQKKNNINFDSNIIRYIYNFYEGFYDNYTLLELIYELYLARIQITCPWRKKDIINMIKERKLDIPSKFEKLIDSKWEHYYKSHYYSCINIYKADIELNDGDIFKLQDGNIYSIKIEKIDDNIIYIYLQDINTNIEKRIKIEEFIKILDYDDITILQLFDKLYFSSIIL